MAAAPSFWPPTSILSTDFSVGHGRPDGSLDVSWVHANLRVAGGMIAVLITFLQATRLLRRGLDHAEGLRYRKSRFPNERTIRLPTMCDDAKLILSLKAQGEPDG